MTPLQEAFMMLGIGTVATTTAFGLSTVVHERRKRRFYQPSDIDPDTGGGVDG